MRIVLLGGTGFIGSNLATELVASGHDVTSIARHPARDRLPGKPPAVRYAIGDIRDLASVEPRLEGADAVVHLVGSTLPAESVRHPTRELETVVLPTVGVLEACARRQVGKVVFLSSGGTVYGVPEISPIPESHALRPINPYGLSKLAIERLLEIYQVHHGLDFRVLRLANPYGPGQDPGTGQGVIARWMDIARNGGTIEVWGDGSVVRDYVDIREACAAIRLATEDSSHPGRTYNVGSGTGHSLREVIATMRQVTGIEVPVRHLDARGADVPANVLDVGRIGSDLGWRPRVSLQAGMRAMWTSLVHGASP